MSSIVNSSIYCSRHVAIATDLRAKPIHIKISTDICMMITLIMMYVLAGPYIVCAERLHLAVATVCGSSKLILARAGKNV